MALSQAQYHALHVAMQADANNPLAMSDQAAAIYLQSMTGASTPATTQVMIWLPAVAVSALNSAIDWTTTAVSGGNGGFQAFSQAARDAYFAMTQGGTIDSTQANIRNGFGSIFPTNVAAALTMVAQRAATVFESYFTTANVCPAPYFGFIPQDTDVNKARSA
jgi:hypothetical protein